MFSRLFSELLVIFLIVFSSMRFLYGKRIQFDILSSLPLVALIISILNFVAFGFHLSNTILAAVSLLSFLWNIRYLNRLANHLFLDHFSTWFIATGCINTIICLVVAFNIINYRPMNISLRSAEIYETKTYYTGSFEEGFTKDEPFKRRTATLYKYEKYVKPYHDSFSEMRAQAKIIELEEKGETPSEELVQKAFSARNVQIPYVKKGTVFILPNKCSSPENYLPLIYQFVQKGYTVYTADFYADDMRWFNNYKDLRFFRRTSFLLEMTDETKKAALMKDNDYHSSYFVQEILTMIKMAEVNDDLYKFVIGDLDSSKALQMLHTNNMDFFDSCYDLSSVESYATPGYGMITITDPLLAHRLGFKKETSLDSTIYIADTLETELEFQAKINQLQKQQDADGNDEQQDEVIIPEDQQLQIEEFQIENQFDMTGLE